MNLKRLRLEHDQRVPEWSVGLGEPTTGVGQGPGTQISLLNSNRKLLSQELRREVSAVRPDKRFQLRVQLNLPKRPHIAQWFEHGATQLLRKIDLALEPGVEAKPDRVPADVLGSSY